MSTEKELMTPIIDLGMLARNHLWIKREDLIPFSFGGNKARKARLFFQEIENGKYDCVVTYGSSSSNHCRVIANECYRRGIGCYIICPIEASYITFNSQLIDMFGAELTVVSVDEVHDTIYTVINSLRDQGKRPFFIEGGGHGNIGTEAYVRCYREIKEQERDLSVYFDYIFFPSGTGTTQAGLVSGQLLEEDDRRIVGISIARKNPRGRDIVLDSIRAYLGDGFEERLIQDATVFVDDYTEGYGRGERIISDTVETVMRSYGVPMDEIYTGKAFWGMTQYINGIEGKNLLFIHTGGTPLFFDHLFNNRVDNKAR